MFRISLATVSLGFVLSTLSMPALAQTGANDATTTDVGFLGSTVGDDALGSITGREDVGQVATAEQVAGVSNNSVGDHVQTGDAKIADNAFQNLSGLSILNVNTGNNVAINAAMNVNIAIQSPQ